MTEPEDLLAFLAYKHKGDWEVIYEDIKNRVFPSQEEIDEGLSKIKSNYISLFNPLYPVHLKNIFRPPFVLFYYGDISLIADPDKNLSVVGSRDYSEYGAEMTRKIVKEVIDEYTIVSGLARGIDTIAHETAVKNGGKTIAVLGCGIDYCYPKENIVLYNDIKKNHLLISEYPGDTPPTNDNFPIRNRIIAGLSKGLLVTEAHYKSGSGITAHLALDFGRQIMFVPYHANEESLCNAFIRDGGFLVEDGEDVKDVMDSSFGRKNLK